LVEFTAVNLPDGSIIDYQSPHRIHRWGLFDAYEEIVDYVHDQIVQLQGTKGQRGLKQAIKKWIVENVPEAFERYGWMDDELPPVLIQNILHKALAAYSVDMYMEWVMNEYVNFESALGYIDLERGLKELQSLYQESEVHLGKKEQIVELKRQIYKEVAMVIDDLKTYLFEENPFEIGGEDDGEQEETVKKLKNALSEVRRFSEQADRLIRQLEEIG
jgi:hypothetical protein